MKSICPKLKISLVSKHSLELNYGQNLKSSTTKMKYVEDFIFMF